MTPIKIFSKFVLWIAFWTTVGGLLPSSVWFSQYYFLGASGTHGPLDYFFVFGATPGAVFGILVGLASLEKDATPEQQRSMEGIALITFGLLAAFVGGWHYVRTATKADWPSEEARFDRMSSNGDSLRAVFKYSGGEARLGRKRFSPRYSKGDSVTIYVNPRYRKHYSISNRPGYIGLSIALAIALAASVKGVRHMRSP